MLKINGKFVSGSNSHEELNEIIFEWFGSNGYVEVLGGTNYCELGWECLIDEMEGRAAIPGQHAPSLTASDTSLQANAAATDDGRYFSL